MSAAQKRKFCRTDGSFLCVQEGRIEECSPNRECADHGEKMGDACRRGSTSLLNITCVELSPRSSLNFVQTLRWFAVDVLQDWWGSFLELSRNCGQSFAAVTGRRHCICAAADRRNSMLLLTIATLLALSIPGITLCVFALERWQNWQAARRRQLSRGEIPIRID